MISASTFRTGAMVLGTALGLFALPGGVAAAATINARVTWVQHATGGGSNVIVNRGTNAGMRKGTKVYFLQGKTKRYLSYGGKRVEFRCATVTANECKGKVMLTIDSVRANRYVKIKGVRARVSRGRKAKGRVVGVRLTNDRKARVVINRGKRSGLRKRSKVYFLQGKTGRYLKSNGKRVSFRCIEVERNSCMGVVPMTIDQVKANRYIYFSKS